MNFSKLIYLFLTIFLTFDLNGQKKKLAEGYVVTHRSDTVLYTFSPRNWNRQPVEIKIKLNGKDSTIWPNQINGFIIPSLNMEYKAREVRLVKYIIDQQFAQNGYLPDYDTARVAFLKVLYNGRLNLLLFQDKLENKHYFIGVGDEVTEIYSHLYSTAGSWHGKFPVVEWYKQYIPTLKIFMASCKPLFSIIEAMEFKEENILGLLKLYDKCMDSKKEE